jgi:circadian clock protein KaiC
VILVDDMTGSSEAADNHFHTLCHSVITLSRLTLDFGAARRRLQVQKLRGVGFVAEYHDFAIREGGLEIFPRLIAAEHSIKFAGPPESREELLEGEELPPVAQRILRKQPHL